MEQRKTLDEFKKSVSRLNNLVQNASPGTVTWHEAVANMLTEINAYYKQ